MVLPATLPEPELERRLADQGIAIFMCNATDDPSRERRHIDQLLGKDKRQSHAH